MGNNSNIRNHRNREDNGNHIPQAEETDNSSYFHSETVSDRLKRLRNKNSSSRGPSSEGNKVKFYFILGRKRIDVR